MTRGLQGFPFFRPHLSASFPARHIFAESCDFCCCRTKSGRTHFLGPNREQVELLLQGVRNRAAKTMFFRGLPTPSQKDEYHSFPRHRMKLQVAAMVLLSSPRCSGEDLQCFFRLVQGNGQSFYCISNMFFRRIGQTLFGNSHLKGKNRKFQAFLRT